MFSRTRDNGILFGRLHLAIRNGVVGGVAKKPEGITDKSPKELGESICKPYGPKGALTSLTEVGQIYSLSLIKRATIKSIQSFGRCISVPPRLNVENLRAAVLFQPMSSLTDNF
jgi:hypothetical protein